MTLVEGSGGGEEQLGNTSVDECCMMRDPFSVLPPVISRTLSPGKRNLLLEEQLLTQPRIFENLF